jgi:hypothetical protein
MDVLKFLLGESVEQEAITIHAGDRMIDRTVPKSKVIDVMRNGRQEDDWRGDPNVKKWIKDGIEVVADIKNRDIITVKRLHSDKDIDKHYQKVATLSKPRRSQQRYNPQMPSRFRKPSKRF